MQSTKSEQITAIIVSAIMFGLVYLLDSGPSLPAVAIKDDPLCILTADTSACEAHWRKTLAAKVAAGDQDPLGLFAPGRPPALPTRP